MKQTLLFLALVIFTTTTPVVAMNTKPAKTTSQDAQKEQKFTCILGLTNKGYLGLKTNYKNFEVFMDINNDELDTNLHQNYFSAHCRDRVRAILDCTKDVFFTLQRTKPIQTIMEKQKSNCLPCLAYLIPELPALKLSYKEQLSSTQAGEYEGPQDLKELFTKKSCTILEKFRELDQARSPRHQNQ